MINEKLTDYNKNDIFWKDFIHLPGNPYKLNTDMNPFRCLLVSPTKKGDFSKQYYPTPLGHMASLLRMNNGEVVISVQDMESYDPNIFNNYDVISFYPMAASFFQMMEFPNKIKKVYPNTKICFFNSDQHQHEMLLCNPKAKDFASKMMERNSSIDYVLIGEAESSFIKLCEKIKNKNTDIGEVPSCLYRKDGQIKISEKPIESIDFRFLPFPARDYFERTITPEGINTSSPRIQASRGCLSPCRYCVESFSNITDGGRKKPILLRDISKAVDEIEMLQKNYGMVFFNSIDSSFEDPGEKGIGRMRQFCNEIKNRGIEASFKIHMRAETVDKVDYDFLNILKNTGIDVIGTGVESGLEKELKSYKKITNIEQSKRGIQKLMENNFFIILGHMMFSPILELDDLPKKATFLKDLHYGWDYLSWSNNVAIYPGTAYQDYIKERGLELKHDELAVRIPYRFEDERVRKVSDIMNDLKVKFPETMQLHQALYDSLNIAARYYNKINRHLWINEKAFKKFKNCLDKQLIETENLYSSLFFDVVDLASSPIFSKEKESLLDKKHKIAPSLSVIQGKTQENIHNFIKDCDDKNLSISRLYLKTWFSMRDSQNTTGGKNE